MSAKNFYITTTLPYVNAPLHMGHALEFVRTDVVARHRALLGDTVFFNTGTDEHGQKIFESAHKAGKTPQQFVDEAFAVFKQQVAAFGITDTAHFVRTTDEHHISAAQALWQRVADNGYIYKKTYQTKYCVGCESEKTDSELVNGECPEHPGRPLEYIDEENYFFKFSALQEQLLALYERNPQFIIPEFRFNEMKAFVARGLEDFSISRLKEKMSWGVPVPGDDTQVMYVWFDALANYISTLGWPENTAQFEQFWVDGTPTQYCGKDNTRFQGVIWQGILLAAGLPNSHQIVVNGFITAEGGVRMSKTLGNGVDPLDITSEYGTDALRYFLLREIATFEDSPFTLQRFKDAYNAGLANGIGNLLARSLHMASSYGVDLSGITVPHYASVAHPAIDQFDLNSAMSAIWKEVQDLDKFIQTTEPFKTVKVDPAKAHADIQFIVQGLATIAVQLQPLMPATASAMMNALAAGQKPATPLFARKD